MRFARVVKYVLTISIIMLVILKVTEHPEASSSLNQTLDLSLYKTSSISNLTLTLINETRPDNDEGQLDFEMSDFLKETKVRKDRIR